MGNCTEKTHEYSELSEDDLNRLLSNTSLDRATILEWHKNFVVSSKFDYLIFLVIFG